jgi:hypothetical protein
MPRAPLAVLVLLGAVQGCIMPAAFGRTGDILPAGGVRLGAGTTIGLAPTVAYVTQSTDEGVTTREHSYYGADDIHTTSSAIAILGGPGLSWEGYFGVSPFDRCELGALLSLSRLGGELRCGALEGELGDLQLALSAGAALPLAARPRGVAELRAGIDLSLDGRRTIVPFVNVYVAAVPWKRGVSESGSGLFGHVNHDMERTEYRLSIPVGVANHSYSADGRRRGSLMIALVPEINLGSKVLKPAEGNMDGEEVRIEQSWALFMTVRGELTLLPASDD